MKVLAVLKTTTRVALGVLFLFTGATHFTSLKHDFAAMVPPPFTGQMWVIYVTGVLEMAGGLGMLLPRTRRLAGACVAVLLVALYPANLYAAINGIPFRGAPPTDLALRGVIQVALVALTWWSTVARAGSPPRPDPGGSP